MGPVVFDLPVQRTYGTMTNDGLISIPLFVFMGDIIERANILDRLFRSLQLASGALPGALAMATLVTCTLFATATGIVGAVVTLMGLLAFPAMLKAGYDPRFSAGVICAGGPALPMRRTRSSTAAEWLEEAFTSGAPLARLPDDIRPRTAAEGYRVQARLVEALGIPVGGWKIGCTSAAARAIMGARGPFAGRILAPRIFASGVALPGRALRTRGLEPEIAVTLARDLPPRAEPYGTAEVAEAIGTFHPAIEIVEPRWHRWLEVGVPSVIADLGANGWLVLGEGTTPAALGDPLAVSVQLTVDGLPPAEGTASAVDGGPVVALAWLANHLRRSEGLRAGEVVSTGTCAGFVQAPPEATATARFGGLGSVVLRFV